MNPLKEQNKQPVNFHLFVESEIFVLTRKIALLTSGRIKQKLFIIFDAKHQDISLSTQQKGSMEVCWTPIH